MFYIVTVISSEKELFLSLGNSPVPLYSIICAPNYLKQKRNHMHTHFAKLRLGEKRDKIKMNNKENENK